ncbi:glycosyltransferase family protein [Hymenobacter rubripertinctus]|uniref:Glycosyltransferase family 1 protein n=1 Tax=Hymenobacter rubripertinctus TaxID=2029981 RepID=A0A418QWH3_9BACT|nr:hypothetical protein [Hymenobacter rubripertinctus]RIY09513.1 hypothetical protein D0T11_11880 [Hymenobacter rubripertinctus]
MRKEIRQIRLHRKAYDFLVDCAYYYHAKSLLDKSLFFCQKAADFATFNYCGFYAEGRLEVLLAKISNRQTQPDQLPKAVGEKLRVLHYATHVYAVGGHTRLIENWITNDAGNHHDLVLANYEEPVPDFITAALALVQGQLLRLTGESPLEQARYLALLKEQYDVVVLHHHPNDLLPALAFSADGGTPVAVMNHGDHRYWLGAGICDVLVEIRDNLIVPDRLHRQVNELCLLPIPVAARRLTTPQYTASRLALDIKEEDVMLLSIGASYKYEPIDDRNFFLDICSMLDQDERAKMFVVGIAPDTEIARAYRHPRLTFVAPTRELDVFRNACDVYVEGYPFSSFTAYLEVARLGKPVQRMYNAPLLNRYELTDYPNPVQYPADLKEWKRDLQRLIKEPDARKIQGQAEKHNLALHDVSNWQAYVGNFYNMLPRLKHQFKRLKKEKSFLDENDIYLYKMQPVFNVGIIPYHFYGLSFTLKCKLFARDIVNIITTDKMIFKDIVWFLFKSSKLADVGNL